MRTSQPGPEGRTVPAGWQRWLLPLGGIAVILALLALPHGGPQGMVLSYSRFLSDVGAGAVRAVTIDPAGQVAGRLATGSRSPQPSRSRSMTGAWPGSWPPITSRSRRPPPCRPRRCQR